MSNYLVTYRVQAGQLQDAPAVSAVVDLPDLKASTVDELRKRLKVGTAVPNAHIAIILLHKLDD